MTSKDWLIIEYDKLKEEQNQRIGFRDNLIFVHLAATGAVASWVLTNKNTPNAVHALLVIPWICIILGWTYIVNDNHISRIGKYVRLVMNQRANTLAPLEPVSPTEADGRSFTLSAPFAWESFHRIDEKRVSRKLLQCAVDEITFFLPGVLAIFGYIYLSPKQDYTFTLKAVLATEVLSLFALGYLIVAYTDFSRRT